MYKVIVGLFSLHLFLICFQAEMIFAKPNNLLVYNSDFLEQYNELQLNGYDLSAYEEIYSVALKNPVFWNEVYSDGMITYDGRKSWNISFSNIIADDINNLTNIKLYNGSGEKQNVVIKLTEIDYKKNISIVNIIPLEELVENENYLLLIDDDLKDRFGNTLGNPVWFSFLYSSPLFLDFSKENEISIYTKGSKTENSYIGYKMIHVSKKLDRNVNNSNYDVWRLNEVFEYNKVQDKFEFLLTKGLITSGEWENAIKERGATDFIGGSIHGDEIMTDVRFYIDGLEVEIENLKGITIADKFKVEFSSDLFRDNRYSDSIQKVATQKRVYDFSNEGISLNQEIIFHEKMVIEVAYLGMLPIFKKYGENIISHTYKIGEEEFDISSTKSPYRAPIPSNLAYIFGDDVGFIMSTSQKKNGNPKQFYMWHNSNSYNKGYFIYENGDYQTYVGERWDHSIRYIIKTKVEETDSIYEDLLNS